MTKPTGEQLTEKFFTEVKGWKQAYGKSWWFDANSQQYAVLPPLHTSLDLCWDWVLPELEKVLSDRTSEFINNITLRLKKEDQANSFLRDALKALGVI